MKYFIVLIACLAFFMQNAESAATHFHLPEDSDKSLVAAVDVIVAVVGKVTDLLDDSLLAKLEINVGETLLVDKAGKDLSDANAKTALNLDQLLKLGDAATDLDFYLDVAKHATTRRIIFALKGAQKTGAELQNIGKCWSAFQEKTCADLEMITGLLAVAGNLKPSEVVAVAGHFGEGLTAINQCVSHCDSGIEQRGYAAAVAACVLDGQTHSITSVASGPKVNDA